MDGRWSMVFSGGKNVALQEGIYIQHLTKYVNNAIV